MTSRQEYMQEYRKRKEVRERERAYMKEYYQRPYVKEKKRQYAREYYKRPYVKERRRQYRQRPEVKARMREYLRKYRQRPEAKFRAACRMMRREMLTQYMKLVSKSKLTRWEQLRLEALADALQRDANEWQREEIKKAHEELMARNIRLGNIKLENKNINTDKEALKNNVFLRDW